MIKEVLSRCFALLFTIFKVFPTRKNKVFFIMTFDTHLNGNIKYIYKMLQEQCPEYKLYTLSRIDYQYRNVSLLRAIKNIVSVYFIKNYHMATSKYVILNNVFNTAAYFSFNKEVNVIQVWHAVGTFKKFGEHYWPTKKIDEIQRNANKIYTHVIVNSKRDIDIYASAFNIDKSSVLPLGNASCDIFFDETAKNNIVKKLKALFPQIADKKVILYAPTFRDDLQDNKAVVNSIQEIAEQVDSEYVILLRLHPHVARLVNIESLAQKIIDVSQYDDVNELLCVSHLLITDYSSIIFEYSILERPIIFYAFDLDKYESKRGFYQDYQLFVPGDVVDNVDELVYLINSETFCNRSGVFKKEWHDHFDGSSSKRFVQCFFSE